MDGNNYLKNVKKSFTFDVHNLREKGGQDFVTLKEIFFFLQANFVTEGGHEKVKILRTS